MLILLKQILAGNHRMSDDDSPILKRGGRPRHNHPVILATQMSPSEVQPKLAVPPSPGSSNVHHNNASDASRWEQARQIERVSRRQQMLDNPFIAHQAVEGNEGSSVDGSNNSEDDQ
jgi:hypothetical protein